MVAFQARFNTKISDLNGRVALCTMHDIINKDGEMHLVREKVRFLWASVRPSPTVMSYITPTGFTIDEDPDRQTHRIIIRAHAQVDVSTTAWAYEMRLKGPPRWYKIIGFMEYMNWIVLLAHLVERSDTATPPVDMLRPQPSEVEL